VGLWGTIGHYLRGAAGVHVADDEALGERLAHVRMQVGPPPVHAAEPHEQGRQGRLAQPRLPYKRAEKQ
jgi:hypothetical protein